MRFYPKRNEKTCKMDFETGKGIVSDAECNTVLQGHYFVLR